MNFLYKVPGYILCALGGFFLSTGGVIIRSYENADLWQILFWRSVFFLMAMFLLLLFTYKKETINVFKKAGVAALVGGIFLSTSFITYVAAIKLITVANVVFIISSQTIFLAIFGFIFLKEKISSIGLISIIVAMGGVSLMVGDSIFSGSLIGNLCALVIPINFSILVMIIRKYPQLDMLPAIFYAGILGSVYGYFLTDSIIISSHDIFMSFLLGVPQLAFGFTCITIGSRTTPAVTVGILMLCETIFAPIWVWLFKDELPPSSVLLGGLLIVSAVIIKYYDKAHKEKIKV